MNIEMTAIIIPRVAITEIVELEIGRKRSWIKSEI